MCSKNEQGYIANKDPYSLDVKLTVCTSNCKECAPGYYRKLITSSTFNNNTLYECVDTCPYGFTNVASICQVVPDKD